MNWSQGVRAEDYVVERLREKKWRIEARNYRRKGHEIDVIASRGDRLICVEVKARSAAEPSHPTLLTKHQKIEKLQNGMLLWLSDRAPLETRNTEFWLCSVLLPLSRRQAEWTRIEI